MGKLDNVPLSSFRRFLLFEGLVLKGTSGGHEIWVKSGMLRPVVLQTHVDPVPRNHISTNLKSMKVEKTELLNFLKNKKEKN